jgi:hypothetical protein
MKVLYFFPHAIYPAKTGAHIRALQTLGSLSRLGAEVHLCTYTCYTYKWNASSKNAVGRFLCDTLGVHLSPGESVAPVSRTTAKDFFSAEEGRNLPDYFGHTSAETRSWIRGIVEKRKIDFMFMCYPVYSGLIPLDMGVRPVMELYDMWTHNGALQKALHDGFGLGIEGNDQPIRDSEVLDRTFLGRKKVRSSPLEEHTVKKYPSAIAISRHDEKLLQSYKIPNVTRIPVMVAVPGVASPCKGNPCMALGPNLLNLQGLVHFLERIMPHVVSEISDFNCDLFGTVPHVERVDLGKNVTNRGFVRDFGAAMCGAGFFINPVFSGTGMQIKTVEAMSFGLPPVCYDSVAEDAGVIHMVNGWVATSEREFAEGVVTLARQPELCKRLGDNAREHIRQKMSETALDTSLETFLSHALTLPPL